MVVMMEDTVQPWTVEQVKNLNAFQERGELHGFTCPNRGDDQHERDCERLELVDLGLLRATRNGWVCYSCAYTQKWAHKFMAEAV